METPKKGTGWVNIYRNIPTGRKWTGTDIWGSREEAAHYIEADDDCNVFVATVRIEWEER
jgi:hypothetical protein